LFPEGLETKLFVVIDEAQVAADHLKEYFRSTTGLICAPFFMKCIGSFCSIHQSWRDYSLRDGAVDEMVEEAVGSVSAKKLDIKQTLVFTNVGRFDDSSQEAYIRRYLTLSDTDSQIVGCLSA
jgi:hypothetical protein